MRAKCHQIWPEIAQLLTEQNMRVTFDNPHLGLPRQRSETLQGGSKFGHDRVDVALCENVTGLLGSPFDQRSRFVDMQHKALRLVRHTERNTQRSTGGRGTVEWAKKPAVGTVGRSSHHEHRALTQTNDAFRCCTDTPFPPLRLATVSENDQVGLFALGNDGCIAFTVEDFEPETACLVFASTPDLRLQQLFCLATAAFGLCGLSRRAVDHMQQRQLCPELLFQPQRTL